MITLDEARAELRSRVDEGAKCPCCTQFAKVYRRKITSATAAALIEMHHATQPGEYVHLPTLLKRYQADEAKARYWGLIEEPGGLEREDGSTRVGHWRLTDNGRSYVLGTLSVPTYALIYDGRCLGLEGADVFIVSALGTRFDYGDLMAGR